MADGIDDDGARAKRRIVWETEERVDKIDPFSFLPLHVKGDSYPEFCAQRKAEGDGSLLFPFVRTRVVAGRPQRIFSLVREAYIPP